MSKGKITDVGTHHELMKSSKIYTKLMKIQAHDLTQGNFPNLSEKDLEKVMRDLRVINNK